MRKELFQGQSIKIRQRGKEKGGWMKMVDTKASAEVRDEKGKTLFSFHVIKYLLCLHISSTDRHSGLKEH